MAFKLEQLPPHLRIQAERILNASPSHLPPAVTDTKTRGKQPSDASDGAGGTTPPKRRGKPYSRQISPSDAVPTAQDTPRTPLKDPKPVPYHPKSVRRPPQVDHRGSPNRTEERYNREILHGLGRYEPVTLRTPGGNYTPDYMTIDDGIVTFHEVKGAFRFGSQSRAILGFKSAAAFFPFWNFVWATLKKGGVWDIRRYDASAPDDPPADDLNDSDKEA